MSGKPRKTKAQWEYELKQIADLHVAGKTIYETAQKLGIGHSTVERKLVIIRERWRKETDVDAKERLLKEAQWVRDEAREAWERSKQDAEVRIQKIRKANAGEAGQPIEATIRTEGQAGDATYLTHVEWANEREAKIRGTDAPEKIKVNLNGLTDDQIESEIQRIDREIAGLKGTAATEGNPGPGIGAPAEGQGGTTPE